MVRRSALVVRGGWEGHVPREATELFIPFLSAQGFDVRVEETPEVYAAPDAMAPVDLIVPCVTMSEIAADQVAGLRRAVASGAGMVGWHGGIVDSYRANAEYLQLVGGQFVAHPRVATGVERLPGQESWPDHTIDLTEAGRRHPVTSGLTDFPLRTEQYWVLSDALNDVLATTTHPAEPGAAWSRPLTCPAVWTRQWGAGRIVVITPGHDVPTLQERSVRTIIERGMLWAARTASAS
ncbi:ThuA domain-containing protein [Microbacterium sp. NPDC056052]|uniref:ThuA domain-containing protein n=1 Tax=Microbacterium sp. NPDC056052 TaxID=3345695 RepID=UPI0035E0E75B